MAENNADLDDQVVNLDSIQSTKDPGRTSTAATSVSAFGPSQSKVLSTASRMVSVPAKTTANGIVSGKLEVSKRSSVQKPPLSVHKIDGGTSVSGPASSLSSTSKPAAKVAQVKKFWIVVFFKFINLILESL